MSTPAAFAGVLVLAAVSLAGCVAPQVQEAKQLDPMIMEARLQTATAAPGQPVEVTYVITYPGPWSDLQQPELLGLPENALQGGVPPRLPLPTASTIPGVGTLTLPVPAMDGDYPLTLRVASLGGGQATAPLGTLTIPDLPGSIDQVTIEPNAHVVSTCTEAGVTATLRYSVNDPNGAADAGTVRLLPVQPRLTRIGGAPLALAGPLPQIAQGAPLTVTSMASTSSAGGGAQAPQAEPIAGGGVTAVAPPAQGIPLNPSVRYDVARDLVTTPVQIACAVAAPATWQLRVAAGQGSVAATDYLTNP
jgi:hypothetical protein